ncbi:hypothetical protein Tco_0382023 [Tanacetum coccineum]
MTPLFTTINDTQGMKPLIEQFHLRKKGSKKKANTDIITQQKPPTAPKEKKSGKAKLKTTELETISEADLTEAEQLKIITKRSRQETHSSHAWSGADERNWCYTRVQEDDDEEQTESDDDGDDFVHPKLTTHDDEIIHEEDTDEDDSSISSSDEEDNDNEVEGSNVEGAKTDEEATYEEDQGNEAVKDTNTDLDGRDKEAVDVAVQLKYDRIREETSTANQQFLESILKTGIDENHQGTSQKGSLQNYPKVE